MLPNEIVISKSSSEHSYKFNMMKFSYQEISYRTYNTFEIQKLIKLINKLYITDKQNRFLHLLRYTFLLRYAIHFISLMRFFHFCVWWDYFSSGFNKVFTFQCFLLPTFSRTFRHSGFGWVASTQGETSEILCNTEVSWRTVSLIKKVYAI